MVAGYGLAGGFGLEGAGDFGLLVGGQPSPDGQRDPARPVEEHGEGHLLDTHGADGVVAGKRIHVPGDFVGTHVLRGGGGREDGKPHDLDRLRLRRLVELLPDRQRFVANGTSGREDEEKHRTGVTRGTELQALAGERHKGDYRERVPRRQRLNGWGRAGRSGGGGRGPGSRPEEEKDGGGGHHPPGE